MLMKYTAMAFIIRKQQETGTDDLEGYLIKNRVMEFQPILLDKHLSIIESVDLA